MSHPGQRPGGRAGAPEGSSPQSDRRLVGRLLHEARGQRRWVAALLVAELLATPLYLVAPLPLKLAIDSVIGDDPLPAPLPAILPEGLQSSPSALLVLVIALQIGIVLAIQMLMVWTAVVQRRTGEQLTLGLRQRLFRHIQRLSFSFLDSRGTADSVYRVQYDTPALQNAALYGLIPLIGAAITVCSMVLVITRIDTSMAIVGLLVIPALFWMMRAFKVRMRPSYAAAKKLEASALHVVQETIGAFRVVKVFGREDEHSRRFQDRSKESINAQVRLAFAEGLFDLATKVTTALATAAVLYIGVTAVRAGRLTIGDLTIVMAYLAQMFGPVSTISKVSATLQNHFASAQRVFEVLDIEPEIRDRPGARPITAVEGHITLSDVSFGYDADQAVLHHVDLDVPAGSRVGIFGPTGAGKTTLTGLLMRIHDPRTGMVTLDGVDLRDLRIADLREQFSVVLQDSILFSASVAENIEYGRPGATAHEIEQAARAAGAHQFILGLPDGYDTLVGERGMRLSGGERQRIAIARAFLKNAPILILDEPTSAVDQATENEIVDAMKRLMAGRTTFMIAHRLSTLEVCDTLVHVDGGTTTFVGEDVLRAAKRGLPTPNARRTSSAPPVSATTSSSLPTTRITDEALVQGLRACLADGHIPGSSRFEVLRRTPDPHDDRAEIVGVRLVDAEVELDLHCRHHPATEGRQAPYEAHVHAQLLRGTDLPTPHLVGTFAVPGSGTQDDAAQDTLCVVTEHLAGGTRLDRLATDDAMADAARWLAAFHRIGEIRSISDLPDIRRMRADEHIAIARRAATTDPRVTNAADEVIGSVDELVKVPLTTILGDAWPTNLIVVEGRLMPVSFSRAAVAVGELDLAQLIDGWPADTAHEITRTYRRARWPDGPPHRFEERLRLARLIINLRAIAGADGTADWRLDQLRMIDEQART